MLTRVVVPHSAVTEDDETGFINPPLLQLSGEEPLLHWLKYIADLLISQEKTARETARVVTDYALD